MATVCVPRLQFQFTDGGTMGARKWHLVVLPTSSAGQLLLDDCLDQMGKILIQVVAELRDPNRKQMSNLHRKRSRTVSKCESKKDELKRKIDDLSDPQIEKVSELIDQLKANESQN